MERGEDSLRFSDTNFFGLEVVKASHFRLWWYAQTIIAWKRGRVSSFVIQLHARCNLLGTAFSGVLMRKACSTSGLNNASVGITVGLPSFA